MKLSKNFSLEELTKSATAKANKIDNTPPSDVVETLRILCEKVLQPIRDEWDAPIVVTCGYRCKKLNKAVGGASNSDHLYGAAADIRTKSDTREDNKKLFQTILALKDLGKIKCRQIIDEYNYNWIHVSINHENNKYRDNQVLHIK